ncbi:MAG: hypothetical protein NT062_00555, partial [Proteobacteria bacterium]|nr:hypothetical protein [Pseudomonadota bacterium]
GRYRVEVYTAAPYAQSKQARYVLTAAGTEHEVAIDQSAVDGWQALGDFDFAAGADQTLHLGDNTGEAVTTNVQLVFDAVRLTRLDSMPSPTPDPTEPDPDAATGGCSSGGSSSLVLGLGALVALRRRRR